MRAGALAPLGHQRAEPDLALQQPLDGLGDAPAAAQLVLVVIELAGEQEGVEREAVARRGDVRAEMLAPAAAQAPANSASRRGWLGANSVSSVMAVKASVVKSLASLRPCALGAADERARARRPCSVSVLAASSRDSGGRCSCSTSSSGQSTALRGMPPARPRPVARARAACGRRPAAARSRSRGARSSWPFQPFQMPGPTARMSATVSTSSSFSRSGLCTMLAKSRMVFGSPMSRLKATSLMVRCCSISQATVRSRRALRPRRGHSSRAMRAPSMRVVLGRGPWRCRAGTPRRRGRDGSGWSGRSWWTAACVLGELAALDVGQHADGADQVLVHRVVVVHVELHHRHDACRIRA